MIGRLGLIPERVTSEDDDLCALRHLRQKPAGPPHARLVGLGELVIEHHEGAQGLRDREPQYERDLLAGSDGERAERSLRPTKFDPRRIELWAECQLAVPAIGEASDPFAHRLHQSAAEMRRAFPLRLAQGFLEQLPGLVVELQFLLAPFECVRRLLGLLALFVELLTARLLEGALRPA